MKKIYLIFFSVMLTLSIQAQLTKANHHMMPGDSYQVWHCDSTTTVPGAAGANVVWNFVAQSTYTNLSQTYTAATPPATFAPGSDVVIGADNTTQTFYSATTGSQSLQGVKFQVSGQAATAVFTVPAVTMIYPANLNVSDSRTVAGTLTSPLGNPTFTGNSTMNADGTGTLMLSGNATFTNVLRVMTTQTLNFTILGSPGSIKQVIYDYYDISVTKAPLFSIISRTIDIMSQVTPLTSVLRNKAAVGTTTTPNPTTTVNNASAAPEINLFPNPASAVINISAGSDFNGVVHIFDLTGKNVAKAIITGGNAAVNISSLSNGLYLYNVIGENNRTVHTGKLTVNR
jgi:hypothetical protein